MFASVLQVLQHKVKTRLMKTPLSRRGPVYFWWRYIGNAKRTLGAWSAPHTHSDVPAIGREIRQRGILVGESHRFLSAEGLLALDQASKDLLAIGSKSEITDVVRSGTSLDSEYQKGQYAKDYLLDLIPRDYRHPPDSPLIKLSLDPKLLEIVSSYLGLWPCLHAVSAWLNFPTITEAKQSQLWHRDPEDIKLIKVFIYLCDVDENCGPFSYIPNTHPLGAGAAKIPKHKDELRVTDDEMAMAFSPELWLTCTGPANTMIIADTKGYHRGGKVKKGKRLLITFTYTSGRPLKNCKLRLAERPSWISGHMQNHALPTRGKGAITYA